MLPVFWQREKDSNPHIQSQSLLCYPYTIPLFLAALSSAGVIIRKTDPIVNRFSKLFFENFYPCIQGVYGSIFGGQPANFPGPKAGKTGSLFRIPISLSNLPREIVPFFLSLTGFLPPFYNWNFIPLFYIISNHNYIYRELFTLSTPFSTFKMPLHPNTFSTYAHSFPHARTVIYSFHFFFIL